MVDPKQALDNFLGYLNVQKNVKTFLQCLPLEQMTMAHPDAIMGSAHACVKRQQLAMDLVALFPTTVTDCINIIKVLKVRNDFLEYERNASIEFSKLIVYSKYVCPLKIFR